MILKFQCWANELTLDQYKKLWIMSRIFKNDYSEDIAAVANSGECPNF